MAGPGTDPPGDVRLPVVEVRLPGVVYLVVEADGPSLHVVELSERTGEDLVVGVHDGLHGAVAHVVELAGPLVDSVATETVDLARVGAGELEPVALVDGGIGFAVVLKQASDLYLTAWVSDDGSIELLDGHPTFAEALDHAVS